MSLVILDYNLLKESVESKFNLTINVLKNEGIIYCLQYPSNPILDCQIINLNEENLNNVIIKIIDIIEQDEYGITTRIELIKLKNWLIKIINLKSGTNTSI